MNTLLETLPQHDLVGKSYPAEQPKPEKRPPVSDSVTKWCRRISSDIEAADRDKRLNLFRKMIKSHQYYDGNFYGYVDNNCQWVTRPQGDDRWYSDNQYYPYVRTALMELARRQTQVQVNSSAANDEDMERVAKFVQGRIDSNRDRTFTAHLKQTENTYALLNGIVFRYTFLDRSGARKEKVPRVQNRESATEEQKLCANCSRAVTGVQCEACGSEIMSMVDVPTESGVIIGYDDLTRAENKWISPNPVSVIVSLQASTIDETPYIKWKQLILRSVLEEKFPGVNLPSTGTESVELRYITNQQSATPASEQWGGDYYGDTMTGETGNELEVLEFQQHWLDYSVYCQKKFADATNLANGKTLPAGKSLGDIYPSGLYFATVGDVVVDMWDEAKSEKWSSSPYSLRAGSMYGHGTSIAHHSQEIINDFQMLAMSNAWHNGVPREFVNPSIITELSVDPSQVTEVNNPDGNQILGYAYAQAPAITLSPEVYQIGEMQKGAMQNQIGAMSNGAGGLADTQKWGETATAISIKRDLAVGRFAPDLELLADNLDKKQAVQFVKNEQKYFTPGQWDKSKGDYGDDVLKAFLKCDIDADLTFTVVPGSYMPKTEAQELARLSGFTSILQPLMAMQNPELMAYAFEKYGIPEHLGGWSSDRAHVDKVTGRFRQLADEFINQNGDAPDSDLENPMVLKAVQLIDQYADIPVDLWLDNHEAIMDALKDWRTTDEGRGASNVLAAAVAFRMLQHKAATVKQAQMDAEAAMAVQQPMMEAQQAQQQQAMAAQQDQQAQQQQQQLMAEAGAKGIEVDQAEKQRVHEGQQNEQQLLAEVGAKAIEADQADRQRMHEDRLNERDAAVQLAGLRARPPGNP